MKARKKKNQVVKTTVYSKEYKILTNHNFYDLYFDEGWKNFSKTKILYSFKYREYKSWKYNRKTQWKH